MVFIFLIETHYKNRSRKKCQHPHLLSIFTELKKHRKLLSQASQEWNAVQIENSPECTKKTHVVNESSKAAGYIINIQKPIVVLYIRHESENEIL